MVSGGKMSLFAFLEIKNSTKFIFFYVFHNILLHDILTPQSLEKLNPTFLTTCVISPMPCTKTRC